ncbi:iron chelate uptake ABC transporter family permease subunit, partial [Methanoculleus sp. UBA208]
MRRTAFITIPALACALLASVACAVALGPTGISFGSLISLPNAWTIVWDVRLPRVIAAALVGCALAVAGTAMQGLFRNPMADPYIIGTSSGGALGATIAIVLFAGRGRLVLAFVGAMAATFTVYFIARKG